MLIGLSACVTHRADVDASPRDDADTSAFAVIVRNLAAETWNPPILLRVDPHPTADDSLMVRLVGKDGFTTDASQRAPIAGRELAARRETLRRLGVPEDDGVLPDDCAGRTMPDIDSVHNYHRGCPAMERRFATIGLLRRGDQTDRKSSDTTLWTSNVTITDITSGGINTELRHYVLARESTRWVFVKAKWYGWIE